MVRKHSSTANRTDYHTYLASREWRLKRREILARSNGLCERCWGVPATQVHHLTYERVGHELAGDLMAICRADHEYLSAVSDVDPVTQIPSVVENDGCLIEPLWGFVCYAEHCRKSDPSPFIEWLAGHLAHWLRYAPPLFVSLPERRLGFAPAAFLVQSLLEDDHDAAEAGCSFFSQIGLDLSGAKDDPYRRWAVPLEWLR